MNPTKIKWLYLARLCSLTGSQILFFVVPLLIFKLTHSAAYTGIAFSLEWIARIMSFPLSGLVADKYGPRKVYIISDLMIAVFAVITLTIIILYPSMTIILLVLLSIVVGFLSEQGYVSAESLAPQLVTQSSYAKSQSILELLEQIALLFGPIIAGIFLLYFSSQSLIIISFILYMLSALAMFKVNLVDSFINKATSDFRNDFFIGFSTILKNEYLKNIIMLSILMNFIFGLMVGSAPLMVLGKYSMNDRYYALLNLSAGLAGLLAIYLLNILIKKYSIVRVGICAYIATCLICLLMGYAQTYNAYLLLYSLFYAATGIFSVFFRSERARIIHHAILGRTIGAIIFITFLLFPVTGLIISTSPRFISLGHLISYTGIIFLMIGAIWFSRTKKMSNIVFINGR